MSDMIYNNVANWIHNSCTDEEFAETMVSLWKRHKGGDNSLKVDDMKNFDVEAFTNWLKGCLKEILFSKEICSSAWWKRKPEYGAVFIEKPLDEGLSVEDIKDIYEKLSGVNAIPLEIQGEHSSAMGFINLTDAEYMNYDYTALEETVKSVLNDINNENEDNTYECPNTCGVTTIWLSR